MNGTMETYFGEHSKRMAIPKPLEAIAAIRITVRVGAKGLANVSSSIGYTWQRCVLPIGLSRSVQLSKACKTNRRVSYSECAFRVRFPRRQSRVGVHHEEEKYSQSELAV